VSAKQQQFEETKTTQKVALSDFIDKKTLFMIGLAILILLMYLVLENISFNEIWQAFSTANPFFLIIALMIVFFAIFLDSFGWKILLSVSLDNKPLSFWRSYKIFLSAWSYNLMIPSAGASEIVVRTAMSHQEFKEELKGKSDPIPLIISSIAFHKTLGGIATLPISLIAIWGIIQYNIIPNMSSGGASFLLLISTALISFSIALILLISFKPHIVISILDFLFPSLMKVFKNSTRLPQWNKKLNNAINSFAEEYKKFIQHPRKIIYSYFCLQISAFTHWIGLFFIFNAFFNVPFLFVGATSFLSGIIDLIPAGIPGMAGIKEIGITYLLDLQNSGNTSLSFSAALVSQFLRIYFVIFIGIIAFSTRKKEKKVDIKQ
jgi:uncharacterized protein (TIRG00374 family)